MAQDNEWWKQGATEIQPTATDAKPVQASGDWWKQGSTRVEAEPPSLARSAGDSAIALGTGVAQGVKMVSDAFGANNTVSRLMDKGIQAAEGLESDHRKAEKQARAQKIKAAEDSGSTWEEVKAYAGSFADAPIDTTLNAVGSVVPTLAAAALTGGTTAGAQLAARVAPLAIGAVQGAGAVKGSIYDAVEQRHLDAGATPEQAEQRADVAQSYSGDNLGSIAAGAGLGMLAGSTGAEAAVRRLAGAGAAKQAAEASATGVAKGAALGVAKEAPMEAVQGGQERLASNLAEQGEGFDTATMRGVIGQATLEGLAAAPLGGGLGAVEASSRSGRVDPEVPGNSSDASGTAEPVATSGEGATAGFQAQNQEPAEQANGEAHADVQPEATPVGQEQAPPVAQPVVAAGDEALQPSGHGAPLSKSAAMGINPSDGTLSAAAAQAVDSGLTDQLKAVTAAQQQAQSASKQSQSAKTTEGVDADTGEVSGQAREQQILERLDYLGQQGRATGWTQEAVSQRDALQQELDLLNPGQRMDQLNSEAAEADAQARDWASRNYKPNAKPLPEQAAQGGAADVGEANEQRRIRAIGDAKGRAKAARDEQQAIQEQGNAAAALAAKHDLKVLRRKKTDDLSTEELQVLAADLGPHHVRAKALEKAIQTRAKEAQTAINQGAITDGTQTDQTQQGRAQPPQARGTQVVQPAAQGLNDGPAQTENHGGEDSAQAAPQGASAVPALATAQGEKRARQITRESSEARHQRLLNASESWTRMTAAERQAVAGQAKGMNVIAKRNVHTRPWADLNPKHRDALMEVMAPQAEAPSDMQAFAPETGTLGIPRAEMPQVPTQSHGGLVKHLNAQGIAHETTTVDAASLKPTQAEYSPTKVAKAKDATGDRAVIVSKDGHIIDGHHQAMAAAEDGKPVKAIVLDAPVEQALEAVNASPSVQRNALNKEAQRPEAGSNFPLFSSRSTAPEKQLSLERVQKIVKTALTDIPGTPPVHVVGSPADLGLVVAGEDVHSGVTLRSGDIYVFQAGVGSELDVLKTVFHELFHRGLRNILPADQYVQTMLDLAKRDNRVQSNANAWKRMPIASEQRAELAKMGFEGSELQARYEALAIEEGLAVVAEELKAERQAGTRLVRLRALANWVAGVADKLGLPRVGHAVRRMSYNEAERFVLSAIDASGKAAATSTQPPVSFRRTDASTPQPFDVPGFLKAINQGRPDVTAQAQEQAVQRVQGTLDAIRKAWANGPEVVLAYDMADTVIPEAVRRADQKQRSGGASGEPEGFYHQGKVYLLASQLKTPNDAARVLFHESLGHHGLRGAFGKELDGILNQIATMRKADVDAKIREYGLREGNSQDRRIAAEEVLAEMAQSTPEIGFVKRAVAAIRTWLRKNVPGLQSLKLTDAEIINNYLMPARAWVETELGVSQAHEGSGIDTPSSTQAISTLSREGLGADSVVTGDTVPSLDRATHRDSTKRGGPTGADDNASLVSGGPQGNVMSGGSKLTAGNGKVSGASVGGATQSSATQSNATRSRDELGADTQTILNGANDLGNMEGNQAIWSGSEPRSAVTGQQPLYAGKPEQNSGQAAPIAQADDKRVSTKESLLNYRVSRADAKASGRSGSNNSGDATNLPSSRDAGKVSALEQGKPMLSRSARKPDDFVSSPDGGLDFGEISAEMGKAMRRQAGAIRLRQGNEAWGLTHIEMRHGRDVVAMGYSDVQDFVSKVAKGFTKIYSGRGAALDVVIDNEARGMLIVSLEPAADGDFYDIKTATPIRRDQFKNEKALWERTGPSASTVKDSPPYPRSQSDEVILPLASKNDNDAPMFSRSKLADLKDKGMKLAHDALTHPGKVSLWDKTVGTMRHVSERYPAFKPVFESAQQFIDDVASVANQAAQVAPRLIPRVETVGDMVGKNRKRAISVGDNKAIGKALFGGTLDWGRDQHGKAMPMDALRAKYQGLTVDQKAEVLLAAKKIDPRMMAAYRGKKLDQFETIINQKFESTILKAGAAFNHKELKEFFNLNDQQISLYDEARATVDKSLDITARAEMLRTLGRDWDGMRNIVMDAPTLTEAWKLLDDELEHRAKQYPDTRDRLATQMQQLSTTLSKAQELMDHGYMPLQRFGKYTLDVLDQNGERLYYGMFESKTDSHKMLEAMRREFPDAKITQGTMNEHKHKLMAGITPETAELFGSMLGLDAEGNQEKDKAFQEYLKLAKNNHSAMKRLIHRKGILGYSDDVGRVLASFVYSNARVSATGLNAGKMEAAINDLNTKHKEEGELGEIAAKLRSYIQDPQEEGQAIRGMLFAQYLGGSLASAAVNMTQPFAVTLPWLSQYGGMAKASKYMSGALRDMVKRGNKYESDLAHALKMAEDDGVVSPQEIHQLMAQARGAGGLRTGDGTKMGDARAAASNAWEKGKVAWGQPFALAEQFNRRSTFIAAYRLARDRGMDSPAQFARDAVVETQFLYTKANKPQWARGAVGGTLFTFKTYSVSFLELMHRTWNAGESGSPERAAGRRAVGWAMLMLMLMGGAGGMPFVEDVEDLVDGAGQMMGYNLSSKQWRKDLMREVLGGELAEFMDSGLSGLPGAPIDVSGRLGMGNLIPGTGLLLNKQSNTRDMVEMLGPAGDLVARGFSGAKSVASGVINRDAASIGRGAMEVMPNAVRNAAKGADMAASGIYKDSKGYKVIDTSLDEALWKAIGFQPRSVAEVQESNSFMQRAKSFYTQTSNDIRAQWAKALFEKDEAGVRRVRERLAQWNEQNPDQPIRINMPDIWKRARQMGKDRTARIADTAPTAIRQQMREFAARE